MNPAKTVPCWSSLPAALVLGVTCLTAAGCGDQNGFSAKAEPADPKAFTPGEFDRVRGGLTAINLGQMLIQRTHPTGKYTSTQAPRVILSSDKREIIAKVTVRWTGGVTEAKYETDFTVEISKDRVRISVDRDLAVFQIAAENLRLAEMEVLNVVKPLL